MAHAHSWTYFYVPGDAFRYCSCGARESVAPDGKSRPVTAKERGFVEGHIKKMEKKGNELYWQMAYGVLEKRAAPSWVRHNAGAMIAQRLGKPQLTPPDSSRQPGRWASGWGSVSPTKRIRDELISHAPTFSTPEALGRHQKMREMQARSIEAREGVVRGAEPMTGAGVVHMPEDFSAWGQEHGLFPKYSPIGGHARTLRSSVLHHELAERAMVEGSKNYVASEAQHGRIPPQDAAMHVSENGGPSAVAGHYPLRPMGSHGGAAPLIAEHHITATDPDAHAVQAGYRRDADDRRVTAKMRQMGATPNYPLPLGGRAHRKLEASLLQAGPQHEVAQLGRALSLTDQGAPYRELLQRNGGEWNSHIVHDDPVRSPQHALPLFGSVRRTT